MQNCTHIKSVTFLVMATGHVIAIAMPMRLVSVRVTNMIKFYLNNLSMKSSIFQIRKVRGIVPGGCLHQREVRLAQVSCGIVAGGKLSNISNT